SAGPGGGGRGQAGWVDPRGGHTAYVNSLAFRKAGIDEKTPDPPGGKIDRDPTTGKLTGRVAETGAELIRKVVPLNFTSEDSRQGVKLISKMLAKVGITSAHEAQGTPTDLRAYLDARDAGELLYRACCLINYRHLDSMIEAGGRTRPGDGWGRRGGIHWGCRGHITQRTPRPFPPN